MVQVESVHSRQVIQDEIHYLLMATMSTTAIIVAEVNPTTGVIEIEKGNANANVSGGTETRKKTSISIGKRNATRNATENATETNAKETDRSTWTATALIGETARGIPAGGGTTRYRILNFSNAKHNLFI